MNTLPPETTSQQRIQKKYMSAWTHNQNINIETITAETLMEKQYSEYILFLLWFKYLRTGE